MSAQAGKANGGTAAAVSVLDASVPALVGTYGPAAVAQIESARLSVSQTPEHRTPNLAAFIGAVRIGLLRVSQTEFGQNRRRNGDPIRSNVSVPGSGFFSLVANVEQGGRRSAIPAGFITFLSEMTSVPVTTVQAMADADAAVQAGFGTANRNGNRNGSVIVVCQTCAGSIESAESADVVQSTTGHGFAVVHKVCPKA